MARNFRVQSAMEYLMTYGWAILIIAVVLGALFSLGIFNGSSLLGTACIAGPGYLCTGVVLGITGNLLFTFGQSTGSNMYNVGMACGASSSSAGLPANVLSMVLLASSGATTSVPANGVGASGPTGITLTSGQTLSVSGLQCYGTNGQSLIGSATSVAIGTAFSGSLWANFTINSGAISSSNPALTVKFATISARVV